jgi:uncharacterized protein (TIGR02996 family)
LFDVGQGDLEPGHRGDSVGADSPDIPILDPANWIIHDRAEYKLSAAQKKRIERDIEAKRHASEQERNERRDRVLYLRRFSPQNRKWLKGFTLATVRGMEVYPRRRRPQTDDEATFLRNLTNDDVTGWLVYADWLDDNAAGGGTSGKGLLSDQIRYEASRAERTR